jgi:hypothetical protein
MSTTALVGLVPDTSNEFPDPILENDDAAFLLTPNNETTPHRPNPSNCPASHENPELDLMMCDLVA